VPSKARDERRFRFPSPDHEDRLIQDLGEAKGEQELVDVALFVGAANQGSFENDPKIPTSTGAISIESQKLPVSTKNVYAK